LNSRVSGTHPSSRWNAKGAAHRTGDSFDNRNRDDWSQMSELTTRRLGAALAGGLVLAGAVGPGVAHAESSSLSDETTDGTRAVVDEESGTRILISNEGNCELLSVEVESQRLAPGDAVGDGGKLLQSDEANSLDFSYSVDDKCHVSVDGVQKRSMRSDAEANSRAGSSLPSDVKEWRCPGSNPHDLSGYYGNWMNGTRVLQDPVNIDIAKNRYHHDRVWNGTKTFYKEGRCYARASTSDSTSWNHPQEVYAEQYDKDPAPDVAYAFEHATFHSDFLWCNFESGQNFKMQAYYESYDNGTWWMTIVSNRECSGTHISSSYNTSTSAPSGY
jgi:hypothetical protein